MLISLIILSIVSSAVTNDKRKSIIYSRIMVQGLILASYISYNNLFVKPLEKGIGLYGGMFNITAFTQGFNLFIILVVSVIISLTAFYPRIIESITIETFGDIKEKSKRLVTLNVNRNNKTKDINYDYYGYLGNKEKFSHLVSNMTNLILPKNLYNSPTQFSIIEYALILSFVLCGAILLMSTGDLISMFLSIELQSYGLYILCTLHRDSESATNSGLTYFLLGGMSSCFILFGSALLYVNSGTTNLDNIYIISSLSDISSLGALSDEDVAYNIYKPHYIGISLIFIIVGFLFKVSAAPFHFWSPDVYDGIPTIVTTFVAIVAKISIFVFILQLILNIEFNSEINLIGYDALSNGNLGKGFEIKWKDVLLMSSLASLVIGSILGLTQYRIKRLLAYSTISHVGFILLALSVGKVESVQGYIFYILQYTISNINVFFILIAIGLTTKFILDRNNVKYNLEDEYNSPIQLISQLKGYFYSNPFMSLSLSITFFSFVGVPPLIGFFAKQMVLSAALDEGYVFITLVAILTSVIGAVYYLNVVKTMFFYPYDKLLSKRHNVKSPSHTLSSAVNGNVITLYGNSPTTNVRYTGNISINSTLSVIISILTIVILTFMCVPNEWLRVASILSITLFKL